MVLEVIERLRGRFYGKYRGTVTDVDGKRGRIKALVPAVLGDTKTGWCDPCVPYAGPQVAFLFLPETNAGVWIEFEGGDVSYPIWSGCYWHTDDLPKAATPTHKLIQTKSGHQILINDDSDDPAPSITITDANKNTIVLDSSGVLVQYNGSTNQVKVDDSGVTLNDDSLQVT